MDSLEKWFWGLVILGIVILLMGFIFYGEAAINSSININTTRLG